MPSADPDWNQIAGGTRSASTRILCILVVAAALIGAGVGATPSDAARASTPTTISNQEPKPAPTIWGACPVNGQEEAENKLVRRFSRGPGVSATGATMPGGASNLLCGNIRYGYYHIVDRHYVEWNEKSIKTSENWRDVADYSIAESLRNPMSVAFRPNTNTFCYSREVSLINKVRGIIVEVMHPNVVVRAQDGAIITAFPSRKPC